MTKKKAPARKRVRKSANPTPTPLPAATDASVDYGRAEPAPPAADTRPANFGLIYTHLGNGRIVMGVQGPSFTIFRTKQDAVEFLRGLARSIETSWPTE